MSDRTTIALTGALLLVAVTLAYSRAPTLPHIWDDHALIVENPLIAKPGRLSEIFSSDLFFAGAGAQAGLASEYFRPLATLTFWLEARIFGNNPAAGHVTNVLVHLLATLLALLLLIRLGTGERAALVAAGFFALNPIQTEVVYWISARGDSLALVFVLSAMLALSRGDRPPVRVTVAGVLVLLALLAKETAVGMLPLVVATPLVRPEQPSSTWRQAVAAMVACAAAVAVWLMWRGQVGVFVPGDSGLTLGADLLVDFLTVLATLVGWCALPFGLGAAHDYAPENAATLAAAAAGLLAAVALAALAWRRGVRLPAIALASLIGHCLVIALPIRGIDVIGERYAYPVPLLLALFAVGASRSAKLSPVLESDRVRKAAFAASIIVIAALFVPTVWMRAGAWRSERALFTDAIAATDASEARRLLASHLAHRERDYAGAAALYRQRVESRPLDASSWNNLAACLIELGRFEEARAAASRARQLDPGRRSAWLNEATALSVLGSGAEALDLLDSYLEWRPPPSAVGPRSLPVDERYHQVRALAEDSAKNPSTIIGNNP